jgi:hypothetical protein
MIKLCLQNDKYKFPVKFIEMLIASDEKYKHLYKHSYYYLQLLKYISEDVDFTDIYNEIMHARDCVKRLMTK